VSDAIINDGICRKCHSIVNSLEKTVDNLFAIVNTTLASRAFLSDFLGG
jgi:hypothetical protein